MIALTFALPTESSGFRARLRERESQSLGDIQVITGRISGKPVHVLHVGVGKEIAAARLRRYLDGNRPSLVIAAGFAGATRANYRVGDLVLASNFSKTDLVSTTRRVLREQNVHTGEMFTADAMIDSLSEREEISRQYEAIAIDMETAAIHEICAKRGITMLSLRVLSDTPRHPFPVPGAVLFDVARQRVPYLRLAFHLVQHPEALPKLIRFERQISQARRSLTTALVKLLQSPV